MWFQTTSTSAVIPSYDIMTKIESDAAISDLAACPHAHTTLEKIIVNPGGWRLSNTVRLGQTLFF